ncbi:hypothetical protein PHYBOEH_009797 [Phytophthora boehmeriae]|uniref:FYVE-type domain-containing protein n=1 Tax=Phytophthora boehmeriae TaxID=109152 RepID=A0A8T1VW30_9STRA|nr:hypothetical protein PHYBOEH_009797 [Phytophthora boehmeriae]
MANEVLQRRSVRTMSYDNSAARAETEKLKQSGLRRQDLWAGLQQRLAAAPKFGSAFGSRKDNNQLEDSDEENDDVVEDSYLGNGPRSTERIRCRSAVSADGRESKISRDASLEADTSLLSVAQKAGCFSYIKRRHSIALAFASDDPCDEIREPSNISPPEEYDADPVGSNWETAKAKNGVQLFRSKRSRCEVRGVTQVNASVKNVMAVLAAGETTEEFANSQKIILGADQVIEARVLASCARPTSSRYFHCGLKYQAMKNPFGTSPLDLVFLDYTDVSTTSDGKLLGVRILESIRIPELRPDPKYVRASIRCEVYTVQETGTPGVVEVTFASHLDPKSKCSSSKRSHWLEQAATRLSNLRAHAEKTSIGHHVIESDNKEMNRKHRAFTSGDKKDKQQRNCNVCQSSFSFLRKRHICRLCDEATCGRCCRKLPVLVESESTRVKVCLSCILHSRNNPDEIGRTEIDQPTRRGDIGNSTFIVYDE